MSAFAVFYVNQIPSPIRIIHSEAELSLSAYCVESSCSYGADGAAVDVCFEWFVIVFPPPTPTDAVYFVFQPGTVHRFSVGTDCNDIKHMIFICFDISALRLVQVDTYVWRERRVGDRLSLDTGISTRLEYLSRDVGLKHARGIFRGRKFQHESGIATFVQCTTEYIGSYRGEFRSRIIENVSSIILELGVDFR